MLPSRPTAVTKPKPVPLTLVGKFSGLYAYTEPQQELINTIIIIKRADPTPGSLPNQKRKYPTKNPPPFAAVFAEVEVDTETGEVKILKILYVADSGRAINPATVEGQLEGGIALSVGYCLTENYFINKESGVLESDNFTTYKIPSALDMPETEVILYEEPVPSGPFGAKGVGQGTMVAVTPAIANAIYDAVGVFITDMPATAEKILEALKRG